MNIISLNPFVNNFCFLISFFTTIYYWVKIIFFSEKISNFYGFFGFFILNIILAFQLISRWVESGHFPLSSLYESLLFLCWGITFIYLILENFIKTEFLGVLISPLILCIIAFTEFSLPIELQATKPLVPALQSNWLFMHVSVMMLSYAGLLIGSILSLTYLVMFKYLEQKNPNKISQDGSLIYNSANTGNFTKLTNLLTIFDNLSYRTIGIGFCFLTLGILSGAVWANETWGTYWSWDPKETWALITWLTFAAYLHTRLLYGWQGVKPASIASLGFILVWVCYLGVNLLGKGLHSYGFFN
jgi:cytochrome c-type biogenesis protein CcsB